MSKLFEGGAKGEVLQLRDKLDGNDPSVRKQAAKRVIALMRQGDNVQVLFSSMLRCVKTSDLELKKLTYLYLTNYSLHEPEQAIMAVNTFIQDSQDSNPLVRALAVRTMCKIKLESVAENMILPLKTCLSDSNPYVRKTASFGVAKLFDIIPGSVENSGLFQALTNLLRDDNPMVVSNTIASIFEINERRGAPIFVLDSATITPMLGAISQCSEWCQTVLFDALSRYKPTSQEDASNLIERLIPFLKHSNPAVVIGSFKCIFLLMDYSKGDPASIFPQIVPPFITLVSSAGPEVQYVVLRTLSLFVLKYPKILSKDIRVFFCKYNDPSYVKMEKLDIIVTICSSQTAQLVLDELNEYCNEVDVAFVRKTVRSIGQIALKVEAAARRCVDILVALVQGKADYAIEESIIVMCDILRKFPGIFDGIISSVVKNVTSVKDPRAKAASIWILGEYCNRIERVDELLDPYLDTFHDEPPSVQLQLLASLVKVYINDPEKTRDQLQFILTAATKEKCIPDVRNRGMIYWRLLSTDMNNAREIVNFGKEVTAHSGTDYDEKVLSELIRNMGTASGVLHIIPSDFVKKVRHINNSDYYESSRRWTQLQLDNKNLMNMWIDFSQSNLYLKMTNISFDQLNDFAFAMNKNPLGLAIAGDIVFPRVLESNSTEEVAVPIKFDESAICNNELSYLQIAIKTNMGQIMCASRIPFELRTIPQGDISRETYSQQFNTFTISGSTRIPNCKLADSGVLATRNVFLVGQNSQTHRSYIAFNVLGVSYAAEVYQDGSDTVVDIKASDGTYLQGVLANSLALFAE